MIVAAMTAPLIALDPHDQSMVHAITMEEVVKGWESTSLSAACGVEGLKLMPDTDGGYAPWPPRVAGMPDGMSRCRECHDLTGKKRPRTQWRPKAPV